MLQMYGVGVAFLVMAIVAALFGFGVVSDDDPLAAKVCAVFFLLASVAAFGWAWMNRSRNVGGRVRPRSAGASRSPAGDGIRRRGTEWEAL
jgi:uncharacterized membrane protein YtjA (UPF0391 family)